MLEARIDPCLLLHNGGLVKSTKFKNNKYVGDPINAVKIFNEKEVDELLLIDIDASRSNKGPDIKLLERIGREAFMPMSYGGGITNFEQAQLVLKSGFEKISLNHITFNNPELITEIASSFGSQSVIVSIDVKKDIMGKYKVYDYVTGKKTIHDPIKFACGAEALGAGELLLNSVDRDGTMSGYDIEIIRQISEAVNIPIIAIGGASRIQDMVAAVNQGGASAAAAGSMFVFQGIHRAVLISYPDRQEIEEAFESGI